MRYCKGRVTAVHHCSGCWEVVVEGEHPGAFPIDNCCIWPIVETEGADWIGRRVEYRDGCMRFLDRASGHRDARRFSRQKSFLRAASARPHV